MGAILAGSLALSRVTLGTLLCEGQRETVADGEVCRTAV